MSSMPMTNQHSPAAVSRAWRPAASIDLPALEVPLSTTTRPAVTAGNGTGPSNTASGRPQPARRSRAGLRAAGPPAGHECGEDRDRDDRRADEGELADRHDRLGLHPEPIGVGEPRDPSGGHAQRDADRRDHRSPSAIEPIATDHRSWRRLKPNTRCSASSARQSPMRSITRNAITKRASTAAMIPSAFGTVATPSSRTPVSGPPRGESASKIDRGCPRSPPAVGARWFIAAASTPGAKSARTISGRSWSDVGDAEVGDELSEPLERHGRTDVELVRVQRQDGGAHHTHGHRPTERLPILRRRRSRGRRRRRGAADRGTAGGGRSRPVAPGGDR